MKSVRGRGAARGRAQGQAPIQTEIDHQTPGDVPPFARKGCVKRHASLSLAEPVHDRAPDGGDRRLRASPFAVVPLFFA